MANRRMIYALLPRFEMIGLCLSTSLRLFAGVSSTEWFGNESRKGARLVATCKILVTRQIGVELRLFLSLHVWNNLRERKIKTFEREDCAGERETDRP